MKESYDKHLNVFWNYNGNPHWEDNLTKAFINTLQMSSNQDQVKIINEFINEEYLSIDEKYYITYDLQNPYISLKEIGDSNCKKVLVGFNPNGDIWDTELVEIFGKISFEDLDEKEIENENFLKKVLGNFYLKNDKEFYVDAIKTRMNLGDSRVDGWIFVHRNEELYLIIGIESKLWKLDPYQLNNHKEKSLKMKVEDKFILKKFEDICSFIKSMKSNKYSIQWQYLDYMEKLGYYINTEEITENDLNYVIQNNDISILKRKWKKYSESFFKSNKYKRLKEIYNLTDDNPLEKSKRITSKNFKEFLNIYFDESYSFSNENRDDDIVFFVGSELAVSCNKWNQKISEISLNEDVMAEIKKIYEADNKYQGSYEVFLRANCISQSVYNRCQNFSNINECFNEKRKIEYKSNLNKLECLEELRKTSSELKHLKSDDLLEICKSSQNKYNLDNQTYEIIKKIYRWKHGEGKSTYNTMSYVRLVDNVKLSIIKNKSQDEFHEILGELIDKHLKGLSLIKNSII